MERKREIWIIGNGLNKALSSNKFLNDELRSSLVGIGNLWEQFDPLLNDFRRFFQTKLGRRLSDEEVLEALTESLSVLEINAGKLGLKDGCKDCFATYAKELDSEIFRKLVNISMQFLELEKRDFYTSLSRSPFIAEFKDSWHNRLKKKDIAIFTINYDGVVDTIFGRNASGRFVMRDFFRSCSQETIERLNKTCDHFANHVSSLGREDWRGIGYCFSVDGLLDASDFRNVLLHLHGSYKYWHNMRLRMNVKLDKRAINAFQECFSSDKLEWLPMIVFGPPNSKERLISRNTVLEAQWSYFTETIKKAEQATEGTVKLVVWGTKLSADPHIKSLLARGLLAHSASELVVLLRNEESAREFYNSLEFKGRKPSVPYRHVAFTRSRTLIDVVNEI